MRSVAFKTTYSATLGRWEQVISNMAMFTSMFKLPECTKVTANAPSSMLAWDKRPMLRLL